MKQLLKCLSILLPLTLTAQIKVDDVGDGWRNSIYEALSVIQKYDTSKHMLLLQSCNHIGYWNGNFSTTEGCTILISNVEMKRGCINDIASALVHESMHLYIKKSKTILLEKDEEVLCYLYELEFLSQIPNVEPWLVKHAKKQIEFYSKF